MSVNVYLKKEIEKDPLFKRKPADGYPNGKPSFNGENLFSDSGILYLMHKEGLSLPENFAQYVMYVTCYEHIPAERAHREQGVYKHQSAVGEMEIVHQGKGHYTYFVKVKADKLEDAQELIRLIKVGTIRPYESYEGGQHGMSKMELERLLSVNEHKLTDVKFELDDLRRELDATKSLLQTANFKLSTAEIDAERVKAARHVAAELDREGGFCFKRTIATRINGALNDAPQATVESMQMS